jgi:hypothetical protein
MVPRSRTSGASGHLPACVQNKLSLDVCSRSFGDVSGQTFWAECFGGVREPVRQGQLKLRGQLFARDTAERCRLDYEPANPDVKDS